MLNCGRYLDKFQWRKLLEDGNGNGLIMFYGNFFVLLLGKFSEIFKGGKREVVYRIFGDVYYKQR